MAQDTASTTVKLRGLTGKFDGGVKSTTPFYPTVAMTIPSQGADEQYGMLGAVPAVREWIGDRKFFDPRAVDFTIKNKEWEVSEAILKNDIDDDRLGLYSPRLAELGKRAARHPDKLLFDLINTAEATACLDGQFYFDTDHAWGDSGSQSNDLGASAAAPTAPTQAEFKTAFHAALHAMLAFVDDHGELMHDDVIDTDQSNISLVVVCPLAMREAAVTALNALLTGGGNTNIVLNTARVVGSARYTGSAKFDLYRADTAFKPFIFQARRPISRQMKGMDDSEFKNVKFLADARYNIGYGAWWNAVRTTFS